MRRAVWKVAVIALAAGMVAATCVQAQPGSTRGVADAALAQAARTTPLKLIDYDEALCRNDRTVEAWLKELAGDEARAIRWTGGPCQMVNELNPIDAGSSWCGQATILLKHPKDRHDQPAVEIFFDQTKAGRPGAAYAFRGDMDGELIRFRRDFESAWLERFPATAAAVACPDAP